MPDLATLGLVVDDAQAVRELRSFQGELAKTSKSADQVTVALSKNSAQYKEVANSTKTLSQLVSAANLKDRQAINNLRELALQQHQWAQSMGASSEQLLRITALQNKLDNALDRSNNQVGKFRGGLTSLAANLTGLNPQVATLTGLLGQFAYGSLATVGVLAGLAFVASLIQNIKQRAEEAGRPLREMLESLRKLRESEFASSTAGLGLRASAAEFEVLQARAAFLKEAAGSKRITPGGQEYTIVNQEALRKAADRLRLAKMDAAVAEREFANAELEGVLAGQKAVEQNDRVTKSVKERAAATSDLQRALDSIGDLAFRGSFIDPNKSQDATIAAAINRPEFRPGGGSRLQEAAAKQQAEDAKKASKHIGDLGEKSAKAAQLISQAVEYWIVSKMGGGGLGGSFGASLGKSAAGSLGGFGGTALGQALFAPILAGAGAGLGAVVDSFADAIFDFSGSAKAAAKALREAQKQFQITLEDERARANGTSGSLSNQIRDEQRRTEGLRQEAFKNYPGDVDRSKNFFFPSVTPNSALAQALKEIAENEAIYIERLKEEARVKNAQFREDLQVRLLRAQGQEEAANRLAQIQAQQREQALLEEQIKLGLADAATLALLKQVHAAELLKKTLDGLSTSVRNAPSGFRIERYIHDFAAARSFGNPTGGTLNIPYNPIAPTGTGPKSTVISMPNAQFIIKGDTGPKLLKEIMIELRKVASVTVGPNAPLADAIEYAG